MSSPESSTSLATNSPELAVRHALVHGDLSRRSRALTPGQERGLAKTLERLKPASNVAIAGAASGDTRTTLAFSSVLVQLSHA
jgi:hypothetical protein